VASDGRGGARLLADLAEATVLEQAFSAALAPSRQRAGGHFASGVATSTAAQVSWAIG
jgi:hypothetical protein